MPRNNITDFSLKELQLIDGEIQDSTVDVESLRKEFEETLESLDQAAEDLFEKMTSMSGGTQEIGKPLTEEEFIELCDAYDEYEDVY